MVLKFNFSLPKSLQDATWDLQRGCERPLESSEGMGIRSNPTAAERARAERKGRERVNPIRRIRLWGLSGIDVDPTRSEAQGLGGLVC